MNFPSFRRRFFADERTFKDLVTDPGTWARTEVNDYIRRQLRWRRWFYYWPMASGRHREEMAELMRLAYKIERDARSLSVPRHKAQEQVSIVTGKREPDGGISFVGEDGDAEKTL